MGEGSQFSPAWATPVSTWLTSRVVCSVTQGWLLLFGEKTCIHKSPFQIKLDTSAMAQTNRTGVINSSMMVVLLKRTHSCLARWTRCFWAGSTAPLGPESTSSAIGLWNTAFGWISTKSGNTVEGQLIKCCRNFPIRSRALPHPSPWRHYYTALAGRNTKCLTQHTDFDSLT